MKTNEYLAIAVGLAAGYFLIRWMNKNAAPAASGSGNAAAPTRPAYWQDSFGQPLPGWGQGTTLDNIWNGKW